MVGGTIVACARCGRMMHMLFRLDPSEPWVQDVLNNVDVECGDCTDDDREIVTVEPERDLAYA